MASSHAQSCLSIKTLSIRPLTIDDLALILSKVWNARQKWYYIGLQLGVKPNDLDCIRQTYPNIDDCFTEMLKIWLRDVNTVKRTVNQLIMALQQETVGFGDLAISLQSVEPSNPALEQPSLAAAVSNILDSEISKHQRDNSVFSMQSQGDSQLQRQIGFKCPYCGSCSIDQYFRNECPKSSDSISKSFPYLDIKYLSDNEQTELYLKLHQETKCIIIEFSMFIGHMIRSFKKRGIDPQDIRTSIKSIAPCELLTLPLLSPNSKLSGATSINEIIDTLLENNYLSFFNYHIAEHLIKQHGTDVGDGHCTVPSKRSSKSTKLTDQDHLSSYLMKFNKFCKRSVFEVPIDVFGSVPDDGEKLAFKVTHILTESLRPSIVTSEVITTPTSLGSRISARTLRLSLKDTLNIQGKIANCLGLKYSWCLVFLGAVEGCIELNFSVPKIIMNKIKSQINVFATLEASGIHVLCGPPGKPKVTENEDAIIVQWTKPEFSGPQSLIHYRVYYRLDHKRTWLAETTEGPVEMIKIQVKKLSQEGSLIIFKVRAVSKVGSGIESEESDLIELHNIQPHVDSNTNQGTIIAGSDVSIGMYGETCLPSHIGGRTGGGGEGGGGGAAVPPPPPPQIQA